MKKSWRQGMLEPMVVMGVAALIFLALRPASAVAAGSAFRNNTKTKPEAVQERVLSNGLQVLVMEEHTAPLISVFVWYRVGLRNEGPGEAGWSHFLEHMLFDGTEKYSGREADRLITEQGGGYNGFTGMDTTTYYETWAPKNLDLSLEMESQRMAHALLRPEDIEKEKGVVISEFEMSENSPGFLLREKVMAAQFPGEPYGRQVIGSKADIRALAGQRAGLLQTQLCSEQRHAGGGRGCKGERGLCEGGTLLRLHSQARDAAAGSQCGAGSDRRAAGAIGIAGAHLLRASCLSSPADSAPGPRDAGGAPEHPLGRPHGTSVPGFGGYGDCLGDGRDGL